MAGIKIEKAADGKAWLICSGLTSMWTELDDAESGQLGDELTKQLEANGYGD
jgi:hypothetical protein